MLLVEGDRDAALLTSALLADRGYLVVHAACGDMAIKLAASHAPDLILLEIALPDADGVEILKKIREWSDIPAIFVSTRMQQSEKVRALDSGANDYVTKPFGEEELLARIRAALRIHKRFRSAKSANLFSTGALTVDYDRRLVYVRGRQVHLTPIEYKLIVLLCQNVGKVLAHEQIMTTLWGPFCGENQVLRVNIANIRRKIEDNPAAPRYILTQVGVGYRMAEIPPGRGPNA